MTLKLLHWNILYKEKIENILETIKKIKPDILCLQELSQGFKYNNYIDTPKYLAQKLHYSYYFHKGIEGKNRTIGNGIFSRFPIIKTRFSYIKKPQPFTGWADWTTEARIYVETLIEIHGKFISFATTHLSYNSRFIQSEEKKKEANTLVSIIRKKKSQYILTGDFNSVPLSYTIDQVQDYLVNCGPNTKEKTWSTKPHRDKWEWEVNGLNWRLDYVFSTKDMTVKSSKIVNTPYSDHLPIVIEFTV
ncbi:endonuclease/exonuclease/phosphatase family protein [Candidatus Roizmanbacteria bacterium]|nr:endonuclease/exonuclease/phosphatase family protein [Candidatus Roizmanbacteria bacterium]